MTKHYLWKESKHSLSKISCYCILPDISSKLYMFFSCFLCTVSMLPSVLCPVSLPTCQHSCVTCSLVHSFNDMWYTSLVNVVNVSFCVTFSLLGDCQMFDGGKKCTQHPTFPTCVLFLPFIAVPAAVLAGVLSCCVWALFTMALWAVQTHLVEYVCQLHTYDSN